MSLKKGKFNLKKFIKDNWCILIIIIISLTLHIIALGNLGFTYTLKSDDLSYINSGITFFKTGVITMHDTISAQIMPGMTFLIAFFCVFFETGSLLLLVLKIVWLLMGIATIIMVYKTVRLYTNQYLAAFSCLFFLTADYIWMDNLILTETPFILLFSLLIYHSLKFSKNPNNKDYILIIIYYIIAVFIRPNIIIFPIFLVIFLLLKKYDFKLLIKQCLIAGGILIVLLIPWAYRNYKVFDKFIPLTYGVGNPLLLGTYQGVGYPSDEELDYSANVDTKMSESMAYYLHNSSEPLYITRYYSLEYDKLKAEYRMQEWWNKDKLSMLKSYLFYKPTMLVYNVFYWNKILNFDISFIKIVRKIEICIFLICSLIILIDKKKIKDWLFLILIYGSQVLIYAYTFAFSRYAVSMFFIRYIIIGIGLSIIYEKIGHRRKKNENNLNYTCL